MTENLRLHKFIGRQGSGAMIILIISMPVSVHLLKNTTQKVASPSSALKLSKNNLITEYIPSQTVQ